MHSQSLQPNGIARSSDRSFGLIMFVFFLVISLFPLLHNQAIRYWALCVAVIFLIPALLFPKILSRLNILWMQFGELLSKIVSPIALGLVFFIAITPFALIMRAVGKRTLDLKFDPSCASYWKNREMPGPNPKSMKDQF